MFVASSSQVFMRNSTVNNDYIKKLQTNHRPFSSQLETQPLAGGLFGSNRARKRRDTSAMQ